MNSHYREQVERNLAIVRQARDRKRALGQGEHLSIAELDALLPDVGRPCRPFGPRKGRRPHGYGRVPGSGKGCYQQPSGRWQARIAFDGVKYQLGTFDTQAEARAAVEAKLAELKGESNGQAP
jgi:hypothetical protein